jgi:hypothetical protein
MQIDDGGVFAKPIPPAPPKVDPAPPPPPKPDFHMSPPPGQYLFSPPPVQPTPPPPSPPVPTSASDARDRVYKETLDAAAPPALHRLPPEDRADALSYAASQAEDAVATFDKLYEVTSPTANPVSAQALQYMPGAQATAAWQKAVEQAWQAYQVLTVDGPLVTPGTASGVVERAVDQTEALVEKGGTFPPALHDAVVDQIVAGTDGLETRIAEETTAALAHHFPTLEEFYGEQGRRFTERLRDSVRATAASATAPAPAASDALARLDRLQERYEAMRTDVRVVSGFDGADAGLDAFGITLGVDGTGTPWTDAMREEVLAQAVRIENAFRADDPDGLLSRFPAGAAFDAIFASKGDISLTTIPERNGCNSEKVGLISSGAITCSTELIEYRTFSSDQTWDGMANSRQYHFAHEFGHAFSASMASAYKGLDETDRSPYQVIDDAAEGLPAPSRRDWDDPAWGIPVRTVDNVTRQSPYQQNVAATNVEYFADTFSNWANGTLLDNDAGRALQGWMDRMAPEWLRARLEASGLYVPPAPPAPTPDR